MGCDGASTEPSAGLLPKAPSPRLPDGRPSLEEPREGALRPQEARLCIACPLTLDPGPTTLPSGLQGGPAVSLGPEPSRAASAAPSPGNIFSLVKFITNHF